LIEKEAKEGKISRGRKSKKILTTKRCDYPNLSWKNLESYCFLPDWKLSNRTKLSQN